MCHTIPRRLRLIHLQKNKEKSQENKENKSEGKENSKKTKNKKEHSKKGWFTATGPFQWPDDLSCRPCNKFGQVGAACFRNNCRFAHKSFPDQFSENDKKIIAGFEAKSDVFAFAPNVSYTPPDKSSASKNQSKSNVEPIKKKARLEENKDENSTGQSH